MVAQQFDLRPNPTTGLISGFIYDNDQTLCGNVKSTCHGIAREAFLHFSALPPKVPRSSTGPDRASDIFGAVPFTAKIKSSVAMSRAPGS